MLDSQESALCDVTSGTDTPAKLVTASLSVIFQEAAKQKAKYAVFWEVINQVLNDKQISDNGDNMEPFKATLCRFSTSK